MIGGSKLWGVSKLGEGGRMGGGQGPVESQKASMAHWQIGFLARQIKSPKELNPRGLDLRGWQTRNLPELPLSFPQ